MRIELEINKKTINSTEELFMFLCIRYYNLDIFFKSRTPSSLIMINDISLKILKNFIKESDKNLNFLAILDEYAMIKILGKYDIYSSILYEITGDSRYVDSISNELGVHDSVNDILSSNKTINNILELDKVNKEPDASKITYYNLKNASGMYTGTSNIGSYDDVFWINDVKLDEAPILQPENNEVNIDNEPQVPDGHHIIFI
jgi:hypothetical protein